MKKGNLKGCQNPAQLPLPLDPYFLGILGIFIDDYEALHEGDRRVIDFANYCSTITHTTTKKCSNSVNILQDTTVLKLDILSQKRKRMMIDLMVDRAKDLCW